MYIKMKIINIPTVKSLKKPVLVSMACLSLCLALDTEHPGYKSTFFHQLLWFLLHNSLCVCWSSKETVCRLAAHGNASNVLSRQTCAQNFQLPSKSGISGITDSSKCLSPEIFQFWFQNRRADFFSLWVMENCIVGDAKFFHPFLYCHFQTPMSL